MLSNFELERLANFYRLPLVTICMKDELSKSVKDGCYIINLQSSTSGSGTHWTALFIVREYAYYFDSFGAPPPIEVCKFVKRRKGSHLIYNNFIIQDLASESCGWFSLAFLLWMYNHISNLKEMNKIFNEFIDGFSDNTKVNDEILKTFFQSSTLSNRPSVLNRYLK